MTLTKLLILFCVVQNILFPIGDFRFLFHRRNFNIIVPRLSHLTFCTPTKSNLYLANSLVAALSDPALYRLLTFHVPNLKSLFRCLGRTKGSTQVRGKCSCFETMPVFTVRICHHLAQPLCRLSTIAYSIYSQLLTILEAVPPSATCGSAMLW